MLCFEYIILAFDRLIEWTGTRKTDKIAMREDILSATRDHRIHLEEISGQKTREYLIGFKHFSTERVLKAIVYELTENDMWQMKGKLMGNCWYQDCCMAEHTDKKRCGVDSGMSGAEKISELFEDVVTQDLIRGMP